LRLNTQYAGGFYKENMKLIKLSNGKNVKVDDEDYASLSKYKWHYSGGYAVRWIKKGTVGDILMHREIISTPKGAETDHIDHDGLNNCKNNLRICNNHENQANANLRSDNTSGFKGVNFKKSSNKWQANIRNMGIKIFIGLYLTSEEAALAYDKKAKVLFGSFANINFK
jgi:hypothetical protein